MSYSIQLPPHIHSGAGSINKVRDIIAEHAPWGVLVFTDASLRALGLIDPLVQIIESTDTQYQIVDNIVPEPSVHDVENALAAVTDITVEMIIGIGGGSVMDTAKLASVLLGAPYTIQDLIKNPARASKRCLSLMIPTTCGTGSEATCNAIVAIPEEKTKKGIVNSQMIPDEVILDVNLIARLPKAIIAATGVDALAHCVECYTSRKATPLSDVYARTGARLIFHNLEKAYSDPSDLVARENLLMGAFYGGVAITGSGTTAVHALSYPLGGRYHIPHGVSNAILFAQVMEFNKDACQTQLSQLCDEVYPTHHGKTQAEKAGIIISRIAEIVKNTDIPTSLQAFGLKPEDLEDLVVAGSQQTRLLVNNMKELSLDDIRSIYRQVI